MANCSRKFLQISIGVSLAFISFFLIATIPRNPIMRVGEISNFLAIEVPVSSSADGNASGGGAVDSKPPPSKPDDANMRKVLQVPTMTGGGIFSGINPRTSDTDVFTGQMYLPGFSISNSDTCQPRHNSTLKLLIVVTSAPNNPAKRKAIRETWGHFALMNDIRMTFLVGQTGEKEQQYINDEDRTFGDVIQANFYDHYDNLTLKTTAMLEWIKDYCPQVPFVLKTDDDMYVNIPRLLKFIDDHRLDNNTIYGRLAHLWKPVRNHQSKYYVAPSTYPGTVYPDFCTGPAYVMTTDVVPKLYEETLRTKFMKLEDVVVTGIAAQKQKVRLVDVPEIKNTSPNKNPTPCLLDQTITFHDIAPDKLYHFWTSVRTLNVDCKR